MATTECSFADLSINKEKPRENGIHNGASLSTEHINGDSHSLGEVNGNNHSVEQTNGNSHSVEQTNGNIPHSGYTNGIPHSTGEAKSQKPSFEAHPLEDIKGPHSPQPEMQYIDRKGYATEDALLEDIVKALQIAGGCVVRNLVDQEHLDAIEKEIRPHLLMQERWSGEGDFWPPETRIVTGLMTKSPSIALHVVGNPIWQRVGKHFLTSVMDEYYIGPDKQEPSISEPQFNNAGVFSVKPGAKSQPLHRDDIIHHTRNAGAAVHTIGRDNGVGLFVAGKKSTKENGATRFVPGSHLWDISHPAPDDSKTVQAVMEPGDGFMMFSGCYHGASPNVTKDDERLLYSTFTTRGYLRQEENQYLANDKEVIKNYPTWLLKHLGYSLSKPFLGWVEMDDPLRLINAEEERVKSHL